MTPVYFAPMEGLTDAAFRRAHYACFPGVERYFIPFISPTMHKVLSGHEKHDVLPEYTAGVPCVPQVLTRNAEHFLWAANLLADYGYSEVNLNAGCPSATVTAKGKGAGILRDTEELDRFLDEICGTSPLPVSVKTRIGFDSPEEWPALLAVYARHPLKRLVVHPRTCRELYAPGTVHMECWQAACEAFPGELVYNGDLFSMADVGALEQRGVRKTGVMLGRGLVANPALAREINGGPRLERDEVVAFHDRLVRELQEIYRDSVVFSKLRDVMKFLACCFEDTKKLEKQIKKSRTLAQLLEIDNRMFKTCPFKGSGRKFCVSVFRQRSGMVLWNSAELWLDPLTAGRLGGWSGMRAAVCAV